MLGEESLGGLDGVNPLLLGGLLADPGEDAVRGASVQDVAVLEIKRNLAQMQRQRKNTNY